MPDSFWASCSCGDRFEGTSAQREKWLAAHLAHGNFVTGQRSAPFGTVPLQLRRGETVQADDFPADELEQMHENLDAIQAEDDAEPTPEADDQSREAKW